MTRTRLGLILVGVGVSLLLATFVSPYASSSPDGLERVAKDHGFLPRAEAPGATAWESAPVKDYAMPGIKNEKMATGIAGLTGALGVFAVAFGLAALLRKKDADGDT
jgi:cobalt/nickel transport protein